MHEESETVARIVIGAMLAVVYSAMDDNEVCFDSEGSARLKCYDKP
jgi:hypothetical protein